MDRHLFQWDKQFGTYFLWVYSWFSSPDFPYGKENIADISNKNRIPQKKLSILTSVPNTDNAVNTVFEYFQIVEQV